MKRIKWTFEKIQAEALKYNIKQDFREKRPKAWNAANKRGILNIVCFHMVSGVRSGENHPNFKWTFEMIHREALKYKTRWDFQQYSKTAHSIAHQRKIMDEICSHMEDALIYWSNEDLAKEAQKYIDRTDFMFGSPSAYALSGRRKIMDDICKHMPLSRCSSKPENELINTIKEFFPSIVKIRDRKIKIEGKPYMKGFDIDGFVPELNLGIEFDGKHHHSFEYMRKDKRKKLWSDDDIRNYHEIKDSWFATKGIKILHIKETDWNKDKQSCIKKCLEFLGIKTEKAA